MLMSRVILLVVGLNTVITVGSVVLGFLYLAPAVTASSASKSEAEAPRKVTDYGFYPIEKIVLNLPEQSRERYFVLDLALQADHKVPVSTFKLIEPLVPMPRRSVASATMTTGTCQVSVRCRRVAFWWRRACRRQVCCRYPPRRMSCPCALKIRTAV